MGTCKKVALSVMVFPLSLALAGCSSTSEKPPAPAAPVAPAPAETAKQAVPPSSTGSSSLEALQKGESTATPASSPLKDVYFDFDSYAVRSDARDVLKADGDWLKANSAAQVQIEGHCDERGTSEYNLALGYKRAQSAKDYLETLGIAANRLSTTSYGKELPVCTEHTEECWQRNRHDRFVIQSKPPTS